MRPLAVLIVGGYGTFGGRLARLLSDAEGLTLLIGGRSLQRAQQFCSEVSGSATSRSAGTIRFEPALFDRGADVETQLRRLAPDLVVDASGPFQVYGESPYRLVEACVACGIDYLDLADGTDFVLGIDTFDERARQRGIFVLSGVSTCPVLTAAAVRSVSAGMARIDAIHAGIAPSPHANVGLNVIRAIASYAGKPIRMRRDGREVVAYPLTETFPYTVEADGCRSTPPNTFSLVDVPDLHLLARAWPECKCVWVGAGPMPGILHKLLRGLAWLVRWRLLPSLEWLAPLMYRATRRAPVGCPSRRDVRARDRRRSVRCAHCALVASGRRGRCGAVHSVDGGGGHHPKLPRGAPPHSRSPGGIGRTGSGGLRPPPRPPQDRLQCPHALHLS